MSDLTFNRHDTYPAIGLVLTQLNPLWLEGIAAGRTPAELTAEGLAEKEPIDLTTALKVTLIMKTGTTVVEGICTYKAPEATSKKAGKVEYLPIAGDTSLAGDYQAQAEIEWPETGGQKRYETVPSAGYGSITIQPDLGSA